MLPSGPQFFPVKALWCGPKLGDSADCNEGCFCADGAGYAIKKNEPDPFTPHNEWLCSHLASWTGLPCPSFNIVEHTDGNLWFGSQWIVGEVKDWWISAVDGTLDIQSIASVLSKIYAF
jgi:hypothetical protein